MSKVILPQPGVMVNGEDVSNHCLRVVVDHTPNNLPVAAVSLYITKVTQDDDGKLTYWFGDVPNGV